MSPSLEGWENTVSAMNGRPSSMSFSRVSAATIAASYACADGSSGQRCLAISSALTKTLPGRSFASWRSTNVDLPAPLGPATRSSRFTVWLERRLLYRPFSTVRHPDRAAVGTVLDDLTLLVEGDRGDAAPGQHLAVVRVGEAFLDRGGDLSVEHHAF